MPIIGWIRDLFGIQKDMYETKKTRLEIEKIEDEKREQLIKPPSLDDIRKYDTKTRMIIDKSGGCVLQVFSSITVFLLLTIGSYLLAW